MMKSTFLFSLLTFFVINLEARVDPPCDSEIYCTGNLLETVQLSGLYKDSKHFVDMSIRRGNTPQSVMAAFNRTQNLTTDELRNFVEKYFEEGNEFEPWSPEDWIPNPVLLDTIQDPKLYDWANKLNHFWNKLGRKIKREVKEEPDRFSIVYVSHGIIVPGGRFREFYYWDSYWIQIGLLHSQMNFTVRGMIDNFLEIVENEEYGFVPNGGRVYYRRSQPPLLIPMVKNYVDYLRSSGEFVVKEYLDRVLPTLAKEFMFWINNRMVEVTDEQNNVHQLAIYNSTKTQPRPESFREDYEIAHNFEEPAKSQMYADLHAGAESGWDFSSRWWIVPAGESGNLSYTRTTNVIPADLNAYLYKNAVLMSGFYTEIGNQSQANLFRDHATKLRAGIMNLLWDEEHGSWFDYDRHNGERKTDFYMSNVIPLWAGVNDSKVDQVINYLKTTGALNYPGGIPTSLRQTGEQWDYPNGWAPLEHLVVDAFARSTSQTAQDLAFDVAKKWTLGNFKYYNKKHIMLEKYDVTAQGAPGGGGEYDVVIGFGWTNGVVLDFLARYGDKLQVPDLGNESSSSLRLLPLATPLMILMGSLSIIMCSFQSTSSI